ncbi:unnamed protein product, partial [Rotaria sp. Silwood2]
IEEKILRKNRPHKAVPINIDLNNIQLSLEPVHEYPTTEAVVAIKPPLKVNIKRMHVVRQIDGQVMIETPQNEG